MAPNYPPFLHGARGPDALLLSLSTVAANPAGLLRPWAKGYSKVISTALIEQIGQPSIAARPRHCHRQLDNFDFVCQIPATYRDLYPIRFCATLSESLLENRKTKKNRLYVSLLQCITSAQQFNIRIALYSPKYNSGHAPTPRSSPTPQLGDHNPFATHKFSRFADIPSSDTH